MASRANAAGNPLFSFSKEKDALYLRRRDAEKHRLYYQAKSWLVLNNDTSVLNIYGEPGDVASGSDGVTSVPATRQFTSAGSTFVTDGVIAGDILEIFDDTCGTTDDNERYVISSILNETTLFVNQDWPEGSLTNLSFRIESLKERYTEHDYLIPFLAHLNPTMQELQKWGFQEKRDAIIELSIELCNQLELYAPKVGDRFIYPYDVRFDIRNIHYEITDLWPGDTIGDSMIPMHWIGAAKRTTNKLPDSLNDCS